jgi:hypothetical protein
MAADIAAPSATALATRNERGRSERCILTFVLGGNALRGKIGVREGWREHRKIYLTFEEGKIIVSSAESSPSSDTPPRNLVAGL